MTGALLVPIVRGTAAAVAGGGSGAGGDVANLRWVGVAFLGAAALCFAGFAVMSLPGAGEERAAPRLVLAILAAVFFLGGVALSLAGMIAG